MARLGTIDFGNSQSGVISGAALALATPVSRTIEHSVIGRGTILLDQDNPYVVVRLSARENSPEDTLKKARSTVEQALNELSVTARLDLAIRPDLREYMVWWTDSAGTKTVRYVSIERREIRVSSHWKVTHADGSPGPESFDMAVVNGTSPSLTYYRQSKLAKDVFEAFRNMYLALEDELSVLRPKRSNETERAWITDAVRALVSACPNGVLSTVCKGQSQESWFLANVYKGVRVRLFHAKNDPGGLVPGSSSDEAIVKAMLPVVTRLVKELWTFRNLVRFPGTGVITNDGFKEWTRQISKGYGLAVARAGAKELLVDADGLFSGTVVPVTSSPIVCTSAPWLAGVEGACPVSDLSDAIPIQYMIITDGATFVRSVLLGALLDPSGFDQFQASVATELANSSA